MAPTVYLDHNATTPIRPEAAAAIADVLRDVGNPSSIHRNGRRTRSRVEHARVQVAALVAAEADEVVFTSGGTEANALAMRGGGRPRVLVSAVEHVSVLDAVQEAERISVDADGRVDLQMLESMLAADDRPALVAVMLANNETGVIQPLAEIAAVAHRHGARVHCDAVQAAGKMPLDIGELETDTLALSAHKLGGPPGCGALVVRGRVTLQAQLCGGGQERRLRAGTENTPGIVGFGAAAEVAGAKLEEFSGLADLRERLECDMRAAEAGVVVFGEGAPRLPNTICFSAPGVDSATRVIALDLAGVAVSAGSACSSGSVSASHVLAAMGVDAGLAASAIRVSLGWTSTSADVDRFLAAWESVSERRRQRTAPGAAAAPAAAAGTAAVGAMR